MTDVRHFMIRFGLISTIFDVSAFGLLHWVLAVPTDEFRSSWFVLSLLTELIALLVLRTMFPTLKSRPSGLLVWISLAMIGLGLLVVVTPIGSAIGLGLPTAMSLGAIGALAVVYALVNEVVKRRWL